MKKVKGREGEKDGEITEGKEKKERREPLLFEPSL